MVSGFTILKPMRGGRSRAAGLYFMQRSVPVAGSGRSREPEHVYRPRARRRRTRYSEPLRMFWTDRVRTCDFGFWQRPVAFTALRAGFGHWFRRFTGP
jgi:hypothetical protein